MSVSTSATNSSDQNEPVNSNHESSRQEHVKGASIENNSKKTAVGAQKQQKNSEGKQVKSNQVRSAVAKDSSNEDVCAGSMLNVSIALVLGELSSIAMSQNKLRDTMLKTQTNQIMDNLNAIVFQCGGTSLSVDDKGNRIEHESTVHGGKGAILDQAEAGQEASIVSSVAGMATGVISLGLTAKAHFISKMPKEIGQHRQLMHELSNGEELFKDPSAQVHAGGAQELTARKEQFEQFINDGHFRRNLSNKAKTFVEDKSAARENFNEKASKIENSQFKTDVNIEFTKKMNNNLLARKDASTFEKFVGNVKDTGSKAMHEASMKISDSKINNKFKNEKLGKVDAKTFLEQKLSSLGGNESDSMFKSMDGTDGDISIGEAIATYTDKGDALRGKILDHIEKLADKADKNYEIEENKRKGAAALWNGTAQVFASIASPAATIGQGLAATFNAQKDVITTQWNSIAQGAKQVQQQAEKSQDDLTQTVNKSAQTQDAILRSYTG